MACSLVFRHRHLGLPAGAAHGASQRGLAAPPVIGEALMLTAQSSGRSCFSSLSALNEHSTTALEERSGSESSSIRVQCFAFCSDLGRAASRRCLESAIAALPYSRGCAAQIAFARWVARPFTLGRCRASALKALGYASVARGAAVSGAPTTPVLGVSSSRSTARGSS